MAEIKKRNYKTPEGNIVFCVPSEAEEDWEELPEKMGTATPETGDFDTKEEGGQKRLQSKSKEEPKEHSVYSVDDVKDIGNGVVQIGNYETTENTCNCPDFEYRVSRGLKRECKHIKARQEAGYPVNIEEPQPIEVAPQTEIKPRGKIEEQIARELNLEAIVLGSEDGEGKGILWNYSDKIGEYPTASFYDVLLGSKRDKITVEVVHQPEVVKDPLSSDQVVFCKVKVHDIETDISDEAFVYEQPHPNEKGFNNIAKRAVRHARRNALANICKAPKGVEAVNYIKGMLRAYKSMRGSGYEL